MMVSNLRAIRAGLTALLCMSYFLLTASAQSPAGGKKDRNPKSNVSEKNVSDKETLQGEWQIMSIAFQDTVIKRDDVPPEWKRSFEKDLFVKGDRFGQTGYSNGKITLDDTRDPKQITIQDEEGKLTFKGIYSLDGSNLKVCMNGDGSAARPPEEFVARKGTPFLLLTLKKASAEKK